MLYCSYIYVPPEPSLTPNLFFLMIIIAIDCLELDWPTNSVPLPTPGEQPGDFLSFPPSSSSCCSSSSCSSSPEPHLSHAHCSGFAPLGYSSVSIETRLESLSPPLPVSTATAASSPQLGYSSVLLTPDSSLPNSPTTVVGSEAETMLGMSLLGAADDEFCYQYSSFDVFSPAAAIAPSSSPLSTVGFSSSSAGGCSSVTSSPLASPLSAEVTTSSLSPSATESGSSGMGCIASLLKSEEQLSPPPPSCSLGLPRRKVDTWPPPPPPPQCQAAPTSRKRKSEPEGQAAAAAAVTAGSAAKAPRRKSSLSKKERKREQNKTAALRYRERKRREKLSADFVVEGLEATNRALKMEVQSLSNEILYLKNLWAEVSGAKKQASLC